VSPLGLGLIAAISGAGSLTRSLQLGERRQEDLEPQRGALHTSAGKRSAAPGRWHKMIFFPFLKFAFAPNGFGAKANFKKGTIGCRVDVTRAAA
jgi:hypothetical protein